MAGCTIGLGAGGGSARGQNARHQIVFIHSALYWIALADFCNGARWRKRSVTYRIGSVPHVGVV